MRKVNIGVIGVGAIARAHIPALQSLKEKCQITAICDINDDALKFWGDQLKLPEKKRYKDYNALLEDPTVEVVDILTPNQFHREQTIAAAKAKKDIIIEKPIARTLKETDDMIKAAKTNRVKLMSAHNRRWVKTFSMAKQATEKIGEPYAIDCVWRFYFPHEISRGFRASRELSGGGNLIDNGWHAVDTIRWLVGEINEVFAYWSRKGLGGLSTGEDTILCLFKHKNEAITQLLASWGPGPSSSKISIYGSNGMIAVDPSSYERYRPKPYGEGWEISQKLRQLAIPDTSIMLVEKLETSSLDVGTGWSGFRPMLNDFLDSIIEDKEVPISGEEGRRILQIILAAYESAEKNIPIKL